MKASIGRLIPAFFLFSSAAIVLGISAWIQHGLTRLYTYVPEIVLVIVVSAITILFESIWGVWRLVSSGPTTSMGVEVTSMGILWVLWLAAAAAWTAQVSPGLQYCQRSSRYGATLAGCAQIQTLTAFLWIGWITATFTLIWTVWYGANCATWSDSFRDGRNATPRGFDNGGMRQLGSTSTTAGNSSQPAARPENAV